MGLLYLKSYLKQKTEFEVWLWNMQVPSRPGLGKLRETVQNFAPDLVGITVNTANWYDALECAKLVKSARPSSHLVMGGVHLSVYPEETINREEIDSIVIGEGEDPLLEMATRLSEGWSLEGVAGVWFKKDGGIIRNPSRPVEKNPDRFPAQTARNFPYPRIGFPRTGSRPRRSSSPAGVVLSNAPSAARWTRFTGNALRRTSSPRCSPAKKWAIRP